MNAGEMIAWGACGGRIQRGEPMNTSDLFYSFATGPRRRRLLMTPVGFVFFACVLLIVVFLSLAIDRALKLPLLLPGTAGLIIGWILLAFGLPLWAWCVVGFRKGHGTPVPFNPPQELITTGPYAWSRNPMMTGVFASLFAVGFFLHSWTMVVVMVPLFIVVNILSFKHVEEPELERRFGAAYAEYKKRVPMFLPGVPRGSRTFSNK
jgi:protein-S-isoprenylcysteine O-methyltransferase Ste14